MSDQKAENSTVPDTLETQVSVLRDMRRRGKKSFTIADVEAFFEGAKLFDENPDSDGFLTPKTNERSFKSTKSSTDSKFSGLTEIIQEMYGNKK